MSFKKSPSQIGIVSFHFFDFGSHDLTCGPMSTAKDLQLNLQMLLLSLQTTSPFRSLFPPLQRSAAHFQKVNSVL